MGRGRPKEKINYLLKYREESGFVGVLGRKRAAIAIGIKETTLYSYENGNRIPNRENACKMAKVYKITLDQIYNLNKKRKVHISESA